jgi:hypothetical protein
VRLADWPRDPYLNDELRGWIALQLRALGVEDLAVYALASGEDDETRRVLIATETGLIDGRYVPRETTARYALNIRLYPWQQVRGVDLRAETYRLWAMEHRTCWRLRVANPDLETETEEPQLGTALAELGRVCAVMADPAGAGTDGDDEGAAPPVAGGRRLSDRLAVPVEPDAQAPAAGDGQARDVKPGDAQPFGIGRRVSE